MTSKATLLAGSFALALSACSGENATRETAAAPAATPAAGVATTSTPTTAAATTDGALGLTARQLEDADVFGADGGKIGEVEAVIRDPANQVTGVAVEVENTDPDVNVVMPFTGVTVVSNGDDRDLRTTLTRDALLALPRWTG